MPSLVSVTGCSLPPCSWDEPLPLLRFHTTTKKWLAAEVCCRSWSFSSRLKVFWSGYKGQVCLRAAFPTGSRWVYWCKPSSNISDTWKGKSCAKERQVEACEGRRAVSWRVWACVTQRRWASSTAAYLFRPFVIFRDLLEIQSITVIWAVMNIFSKTI